MCPTTYSTDILECLRQEMDIGKNSSILTIGLIVAASTIVLASTLSPVMYSAAALQTPRVSKTFTINGNDLDQLNEQARQQINNMPLATPVKEQALSQINTLLDKQFSAGTEAALRISCTLTITYPPLTITFRCTISRD